MCPDEIHVALVIPAYDVYSGGVERTVRLIEFSPSANVRYTAHLPPHGVPNAEVGNDLRALERAGTLELCPFESHRGNNGAPSSDVVAVPTEYWWQGWRRARAARLKGPLCFDFHQLPYIGTLDILKSVKIETPSLVDLARLPLLQDRVYADGLLLSTFQTMASIASVRSFSRLRRGRILGVTPVVAKNLASLGYRGPVYVPPCPNGITRQPVDDALGPEEPVEFDGVYVGRLHPQKGFLDLPFVVAWMKRFLRREVNVAVCGSPHFARHQGRFNALVRALGVEGNLTVLGRVSRRDLYRAMRRSKLLLYPSYVDGFSLTVLESLCLGVPVVAYNTDAMDLIWKERRGVFRVPVGDAKELARAASDLIADSRWEEARRAARLQSPDLLDEYAWERVAKDERAFYEAACGGTAARALDR